MRRIDKGQVPQTFSSFVKSNSPRAWSELPAEIRSECRRHILEEEQYGLSAYTERPLDFFCQSPAFDKLSTTFCHMYIRS